MLTLGGELALTFVRWPVAVRVGDPVKSQCKNGEMTHFLTWGYIGEILNNPIRGIHSFPQECPEPLSNFLTWGYVGDFGNIPIRGIQSFPQEFPAGPSNLLTWGNVGDFVINPIRGKHRFPRILPG